MEEDPENSKESSHSVYASGMNESHKRYDFRGEKNIDHKMCVLILLTAFV